MSLKKKIFWILAILILALGLPALFKLPAFISIYDFSNDSDLATAISGFAEPAISIVSIILIYLAFIKQSEANGELRKQNMMLLEQSQIDTIFRMLDNINRDIDNFIYSEGGKVLDGKPALLKLPTLIGLFESNDRLQMCDHEFGQTAILIAESYLILFDEIERSQISETKKDALRRKSELHFRSYVGVPFFGAWLKYRVMPRFFDSYSMSIITAVERIFLEDERNKIMTRGGIGEARG